MVVDPVDESGCRGCCWYTFAELPVVVNPVDEIVVVGVLLVYIFLVTCGS